VPSIPKKLQPELWACSKSASAAEMFARIVQMEKRGTVVGNRSSGMVMESKLYTHAIETQNGMIHYAVSITDANIVMSDGLSLEGVGVVPDERIIPTASDLAAGRDPALARAGRIGRNQTDSEEAGKLSQCDGTKMMNDETPGVNILPIR
jgi:C-terminal processing protease CtpA/Prc